MSSTSIPDASVLAMENRTGYHFRDTDHLWIALQAAGSNVIEIGGLLLGSDGNKRLALVGDAIIQLIILQRWYHQNPPLERRVADGQISRIASNANFNAIGNNMDLGRYINGNPSAGDYIAPKLMADTVEALMGAIFLDSGESHDAVNAAMFAIGLF